MKYRIIDKLDKSQRSDLLKLYKNEWWTKTRNKKEVARMLRHTDIVIGITDKKGRLLAFARVLTDRTFKAEIYDVIVRPKHRGKGLGRMLIENIFAHKKLKRVRQFNLQCRKKMIPFYREFGFTEELDDLIHMRRER